MIKTDLLAVALATGGVVACGLIARLLPTPALLGDASRRSAGIRLGMATLVLPPSVLLAPVLLIWTPGVGTAHAAATLYVLVAWVVDGVGIVRDRLGRATQWTARPNWLGAIGIPALTTIATLAYPWMRRAWSA